MVCRHELTIVFFIFLLFYGLLETRGWFSLTDGSFKWDGSVIISCALLETPCVLFGYDNLHLIRIIKLFNANKAIGAIHKQRCWSIVHFLISGIKIWMKQLFLVMAPSIFNVAYCDKWWRLKLSNDEACHSSTGMHQWLFGVLIFPKHQHANFETFLP